VALSGDGRRALSGSQDRSLRWWDLDRGACLRELRGHTGAVSAVALSGDGRRALSGSADHSLRWWDLESGACLRKLRGHAGEVSAVALSGDGRRALSGSQDGSLCWWDLERGECPAKFNWDFPIGAASLSMAVGDHPARVAAGDSQGNVLFFDLLTPEDV
jgi:WD40 repeat protein